MTQYNEEEIKQYVQEKRITLFMNGEETMPKCWFSLCAIEILKMCNTEFRAINILESPTMNDLIKKYSSWPMFPQLFIDGEFIGGSHIMIEMYQSGNLQKIIHN
ncbi:MAG: Grx4 family monothiol glutaredoxin [Patescibacteria group bacterium]|nr:Grx4 family monothiol glutaredoxin [Patescibacteria group bacterium]